MHHLLLEDIPNVVVAAQRLRYAFLDTLTSDQRNDPLITKSVEDVVQRLVEAYGGGRPLSSIELLFARGLFEASKEVSTD